MKKLLAYGSRIDGFLIGRNFLRKILQANEPQNHFVDAPKMVRIGSQTDRELEDYHLSRFACYLIAQNADPRKPEIAQAQKYFAIQMRRQETSDRCC